MRDTTGTDYHFRLRDGLLGLQMLFVAFSALVLVPCRPTGRRIRARRRTRHKG